MAQKNKKHCFSWEIRFLCVGLFSVCFWSSHICFLSGISPYLFLLYFLYLLVAQTTTSCQASSLLCFWQRCLFHIYGLSAERRPLGSAVPAFLVWILRRHRALGSAVPSVCVAKRAFLGPQTLTSIFLFENAFFTQKRLLAPRLALFATWPKRPISKITPCRRPRRHIYIYIYTVKFLSGPSLGFWRVIIWAKLGLLSEPNLFSHYKNKSFRRLFLLSYHFVFFLCPVICQFSKNSLFRKKGCKKWVFQISLF